MTYRNIVSFEQRAFPQVKKGIIVDVAQAKIKIKQQSLLKSEEFVVDLNRLNANPQKIRKWSLMWFLLALGLTVYFVVCVSVWVLNPPQSAADFILCLFVQALLLVASSMSWWCFFMNSFNLTVFFDKYTNLPLFSLITNNPEEEVYGGFVETLKKIIIRQEQTHSIRAILSEIPTHILVDEFSSSYLEELANRGIDVGALLGFLQKRAMDSQDVHDRPSLQ